MESRDDLGWSEKKHPFLRVTALTWTASDVRFGKTVMAFYCRNCRKILIDCDNHQESIYD